MTSRSAKFVRERKKNMKKECAQYLDRDRTQR